MGKLVGAALVVGGTYFLYGVDIAATVALIVGAVVLATEL